ncbi:MAG: hypothetical protein BWY71_02044 [Planctomycetes bacterium ADurb.Bin412]|nr:MAG: hypothetical protein BWY71_02044 [Planctomycetes bacterium ADurb.Bin412]
MVELQNQLVLHRHPEIKTGRIARAHIAAPGVRPVGKLTRSPAPASRIGWGITGAGERQPERKAEGVALLADRLEQVIAPCQRYRSPHGLQVQAMPARRTTVNNHSRMTLAQFIPVRQIPHYILVLRYALAILGIIFLPEGKRIDIVILPVEVNSLFRNDVADMIDHPIQRLRIAHVQHSALGTSQYPFGVLGGQPGSRRHPFRLKPYNNIYPFVVGIITDRSQPPRESVRTAIHLPCPRPGPSLLRRPHIPARVHPPEIQLQSFLQIAVKKFNLVLFVRLGHLGKLVRTACVQHRQRHLLAFITRDIVLNHPLTPNVLRVDPVAAFPELQRDQRRADHLTRPQGKMDYLLPRTHMQAVVLIPLILGVPAARPADCDENALAAAFQVIIGPDAGGADFTMPGRFKVILFAPFQRGTLRSIILLGNEGAFPVMQKEFLLFGPLVEIRIQGLKVFQDGRVFLAGVGQINGPLNAVKIGIFQPLPPHFQAGGRILPGQHMGNPVLINLFLLRGEFPVCQEVP